MQLLRSFVFTIYMVVVAAVLCLVIVLLAWLPRSYRMAIAIGWSRGAMWLLKHLCGLDYVVEGYQNLPTEPCVIYMKHSSSWETISQFCMFDNQSWVLKRELMWVPVLGWALAVLDPIAIDRQSGHSAVAQVIEQGSDRIRRGMRVIIFPEGTRMPPGQTRRYGLSGVLLAQNVGCPIVPVAHNAGDFWTRRSLLKQPGTIRVLIGEPVDVSGMDPRDANSQIQSWIEGRMKDISRCYRDDRSAPGDGQSDTAANSDD